MPPSATSQSLIESLNQLFTVPNLLIAATALILLLWLWARIRALQNPATITAFATQNGAVLITHGALADFVNKVAVEIDGIAKCSCRISRDKNLINLQLRIHLESNYQLTDVAQQLERRVSQTVRNTLGLEDLGRIYTVVTSLAHESREEKRDGGKYDLLGEEREY
ncbi:MAG: hypothetical protein SFY80_03545 [Verrucomicrobiota bacterium]|nr:hypothetical protein [Verrucomicrobiota bacterium]